ncbi:MAG: hypothetical protein QY328_16495 [Anaerolineales bacterium]|jgi:hypothetical protein|nr:MAG: hypothetical protein QY328_16495 [Anaerolineales bacterium]
MFKKLGQISATLLAGLLLVYSATRSLDFISLTLPPDKQILAWFGLAALDGGLIAWVLAYLHGAKGWQRPIAFGMVVIDLLGVIAMFTLDTLYNAGANGMTGALTENQIFWSVVGLSAVIGLNIAATVASHLMSPDALRAQAEEEADDKIETATLKQITQNADTLAAEVAPIVAADWVAKKRVQHMANIGNVPAEGSGFFGGK